MLPISLESMATFAAVGFNYEAFSASFSCTFTLFHLLRYHANLPNLFRFLLVAGNKDELPVEDFITEHENTAQVWQSMQFWG